jgi:hypothetical protein
VQKLKDATPGGVLLGSSKLATELDRLDLIDEYKFLVHPRITGHGPTLYQTGLPATRQLELVSARPLRNGGDALPARALIHEGRLGRRVVQEEPGELWTPILEHSESALHCRGVRRCDPP